MLRSSGAARWIPWTDACRLEIAVSDGGYEMPEGIGAMGEEDLADGPSNSTATAAAVTAMVG